MIFWFQPEFELDRAPLANPNIFQQKEILVEEFMLNFPDS